MDEYRIDVQNHFHHHRDKKEVYISALISENIGLRNTFISLFLDNPSFNSPYFKGTMLENIFKKQLVQDTSQTGTILRLNVKSVKTLYMHSYKYKRCCYCLRYLKLSRNPIKPSKSRR